MRTLAITILFSLTLFLNFSTLYLEESMGKKLTTMEHIDMVLDAYNHGAISKTKMTTFIKQILFEEKHGYIKPRPSPTHIVFPNMIKTT